MPCRSPSFVRQNFPFGVFLHLCWGYEKVLRDCLEKTGRRPPTAAGGKNQRQHSDNPMKITANTTYLTSEQVKFLSQLGQFRGKRTWEAHCDPNEFEEAVDLLKWAGIEDVFMHFGN
jgi:hypothetical protein